ncbi:hypothetical protein [Spirillospora sp. NBC_01491]|uniref:hypothetical protein n=1 Tax=Spirillospora sp. NBC_01491 TaxID=2976007 RepID=UPI002E2F33C0|nr:hypothetical protein [Spirillospora sp. NBC_01491]
MTARTPEQDGAGLMTGGRSPDGDEAPGSREIRRRLTIGDAGVLAERPAGRAGASPWQRADEAWREADVHWAGEGDPAEPGADEAGRAAAPSPESTVARARRTGSIKDAAAPAPEASTEPEEPEELEEPAIPEASEPSAAAEAPAEAPAEAEPRPDPDVGSGTGKRSGLTAVAIAAGAVLVVGVGAYVATRGGGDGEGREMAGAVAAERFFAADPAAKSDGLVQELAAVATAGGVVVAVGSESAGDGGTGRERAEFLTSGDAGRTWRLARVRAADGAEPSPGDRPRMVAGGTGSWVAVGQNSIGGTAVWTSGDAREWTRQPPPASFGPRDRVNGLVRTANGFVAAGVTLPTGPGDGRAVLWSSADGRAWQRTDGLGATDITGLDRIASAGNVLVAHGTFARPVLRKKGKKKVRSVVRGEGLWRSADGGRTWAAVGVPQAQGSYGPATGLVAGPGGFYTVREGRRTTGPKKKRKTQRFGVVFKSADGQAWARQGQFGVPEFAGVARFGGSAAGLAALVRGKGGAQSALRSADGRTWQPVPPAGGRPGDPAMNGAVANGTVANGTVANGLTVADGGAPVIAGRVGNDAFLSGVDLAKVPGAARAERAVESLAAAGGRVVAVGSTGGGAAAWSTPAGRPDGWTRGRVPAVPGRQRLSAVTYGPQGWLAVGRAEGGPAQPLVMISADGASWRRAPFPAGRPPAGAVAGPGGYVVVGAAGPSAATWRSPDLKRWTRGGNAGKGDLDGGRWMTGVVATSTGYAAVGGRRGGGPAIWTSGDGLKWTAATPPQGLGPGQLDQVVAHDDLLVAAGAGTGVAVSADNGRTWRARPLTGAPAPAALTGVTATEKGFVAAGTTGQPGRQDVVLWASADGDAWRRVPVHGTGLDGPGGQRLTALTALGGDLLAAGISADHRGETPMLWRVPAP